MKMSNFPSTPREVFALGGVLFFFASLSLLFCQRSIEFCQVVFQCGESIIVLLFFSFYILLLMLTFEYSTACIPEVDPNS